VSKLSIWEFREFPNCEQNPQDRCSWLRGPLATALTGRYSRPFSVRHAFSQLADHFYSGRFGFFRTLNGAAIVAGKHDDWLFSERQLKTMVPN